MKYTIAAISIFLASCSQWPPFDCIGAVGDLDYDGAITAADASIALDISEGLFMPNDCQAWASDFDGDGDIDAVDAELIFEAAMNFVDQ